MKNKELVKEPIINQVIATTILFLLFGALVYILPGA